MMLAVAGGIRRLKFVDQLRTSCSFQRVYSFHFVQIVNRNEHNVRRGSRYYAMQSPSYFEDSNRLIFIKVPVISAAPTIIL